MRPLQLVHRGVVPASGLLFDEDLLGPLAARARILAAWEPTALLFRFGPLLVLRYGRPRPIDCSRAPGLPLVDCRGVLYGAPLEEEERAGVDVSPGGCVVVRGGGLTALSAGVQEDPATWIDLDRFEVVTVTPLGEPPPAPASSVPEPVEAGREKFGVPAADPQAAQIAAKLARSTTSEESSPSVPVGARIVSGVLRAILRAVTRLQAGIAPPPTAAARPGVLDRLSAALGRVLARLAMWTRVSRLLGARQAEYLRKLFQSLDEGDIEEALRTAVPLADAGDTGPSSPALGVPARRESLQIRLRRTRTSKGMLGADIYDELRSRYRAIFNRLVSQGRIDEAAFVLADLLSAADEAVDFLERHGRLRLAAELAEARELRGPRVVRQWIIAGDLNRALTIARLRHAFAAAVLLLEQRSSPLGGILRLHWADWLASGGNYAAAVEVAWKLPEARPLARRWLEHLLALGGPSAARALIRQLELSPDRFAELAPKVLALLERSDDAGSDERVALAEQLSRCKHPDAALAALARPAVRACVRDGAPGSDTLRALLQVSGDPALAADLPTAISNAPGPRASIRLAPEDCGTLRVFDAALLTRRRVLAALGESGAHVVEADGRTRRTFGVPAFDLVVSDHADRALAIARRGEVTRVHLLDVLSGTARDLGELPDLGAFATDFDGSVWFVALGDSLAAIDVSGREMRSIWRVNDLAGVVAISRSPSSLSIARAQAVVKSDAEDRPPAYEQQLEVWRYDIHDMVLRERIGAIWEGRFPARGFQRAVALGADGEVAGIEIGAPDEPQLMGVLYGRGQGRLQPRERRLIGFGMVSCPPRYVDAFWAVPVSRSDGSAIQVYSVKQNYGVALDIALAGAQTPSIRLQRFDGKPQFVCGDDRGRLLAFGLEPLRPLVNARI